MPSPTAATLAAWRDQLEQLHARMGRDIAKLDIAVPSRDCLILASVRRWVLTAAQVASAELASQAHESYGLEERRRHRHGGQSTMEVIP